MLDRDHKSGAASGKLGLVLNERNTVQWRNFSHFASLWFSSKYCYAFVIMHQFQQYIDLFSTITCRQNCSWDGKIWHCCLAVYVVSVWKKGQIFRFLHLYCLSMKKQQKTCTHVLLQDAGRCKEIGFERTRGVMQQHKNEHNITCTSFLLKF